MRELHWLSTCIYPVPPHLLFPRWRLRIEQLFLFGSRAICRVFYVVPPVACSVGEMNITSLFFCELSSRHLRLFSYCTARKFGLFNVELAASSFTPQMFYVVSIKCHFVRFDGSTGVCYISLLQMCTDSASLSNAPILVAAVFQWQGGWV